MLIKRPLFDALTFRSVPQAVALVAAVLAISGCSAPLDGEGADGPPEFGSPVPGATNGAQQPAATAPGTATAPAATPGTPPSPAPTASAGGEQNPANNAPIAPPSNNAMGANAGGSANAGAAGAGAGGSSMVGSGGADGNLGAGGSSMTGATPVNPPTEPPPVTPPPATPPPPVTPPPVTPPPVTPPVATAPDITCPADATFCSGFEGALPANAVVQSNPPPLFDTAVRRSGNQSLLFPSNGSGFDIRQIVVPIPGQAFWARLFIQTSTTFGDNDHDSLFVGSTANSTQDNNAEDGPEFSEQGNSILINSNDDLFSPAGPGFPSAPGPQLAANEWHCVEAFYDGGSGDVQFFADGELLIDAPGFKPVTYQTFRFGYMQFPGHLPRDVWFDDVVVASNRVGCD